MARELTPDFIRVVDEFIEHYHNGDFIIRPEAFSVPCSLDNLKLSLGQFLIASIANYLIVKADLTNERKYDEAAKCITWITHARGTGMIVESESLMSKFKKCEEKSGQLKEQNNKLKEENDYLYTELEKANKNIEEYKKALNNLLPKKDDDNNEL
jgi:protein subunit release factor A